LPSIRHPVHVGLAILGLVDAAHVILQGHARHALTDMSCPETLVCATKTLEQVARSISTVLDFVTNAQLIVLLAIVMETAMLCSLANVADACHHIHQQVLGIQYIGHQMVMVGVGMLTVLAMNGIKVRQSNASKEVPIQGTIGLLISVMYLQVIHIVGHGQASTFREFFGNHVAVTIGTIICILGALTHVPAKLALRLFKMELALQLLVVRQGNTMTARILVEAAAVNALLAVIKLQHVLPASQAQPTTLVQTHAHVLLANMDSPQTLVAFRVQLTVLPVLTKLEFARHARTI